MAEKGPKDGDCRTDGVKGHGTLPSTSVGSSSEENYELCGGHIRQPSISSMKKWQAGHHHSKGNGECTISSNSGNRRRKVRNQKRGSWNTLNQIGSSHEYVPGRVPSLYNHDDRKVV